jgi:RNA 2',3'-cyclic 3'-phosphodiesterase
MRTFIAIKIKAEPLLVSIIADLKDQLEGESMNWVDLQNLHLTLKFLGETSGQKVSEIKRLMSDISKKYQPFTIALEGLGFFKSNGMPRVLFSNIKEEETMAQLVEEAGDLLVFYGFEKEKRIFNPHLTLARIKYLKNKKRFYEAVEKSRSLALQQSTITDIIFFQSILNPSGPVYHELAVFPLALKNG